MARRSPQNANTLGTDLASLWWETASVMAMRTSMLCLNTASPAEQNRMVDEKSPALIDAAMDAWSAGMTAATRNPFDPVGASMSAATAWTRSITRPARANRKRLMKGSAA